MMDLTITVKHQFADLLGQNHHSYGDFSDAVVRRKWYPPSGESPAAIGE
jgi:hypothetical protein